MADNKKTAVNKRLLHVSASPHVRAKADSVYLMRMVVFALLPAAIFGVVNFGTPCTGDPAAVRSFLLRDLKH